MEISNLSLPISNKLVSDYVSGKLDTFRFFDYDLHSPLLYEKRKNDLQTREFHREKLVNHLLRYNERYGCDEKTKTNIEKLADRRSVVVIGGQQSGLLTGPLYTIHKVISILKLAEEQEKELNIPVVPVFWIAGEDHDFAEINHLFVNENNRIKKKIISQKQINKSSVSTMDLDKDVCNRWIEEIFETYTETEFTNDLIHKLKECVNLSSTYVDFFIYIINELFKGTGLVLIDSASKELRAIESGFLTNMIEKNNDIYHSVLEQQSIIQRNQYNLSIEMPPSSANLFYHHNGERLLLEYDPEHEIFRSKNNECILCLDELIEIAKTQPEKLSNNVVTRPLMQEMLFPTLAFISGHGEVAYWAELKGVFSSFGIKMPPIVPRIMMTLVERSVESDLEELELTVMETVTGGIKSVKDQWLDKQTNNNVEEMVHAAKQEVEQLHKKIRQEAIGVDKSLYDVLLKNADLIQSQFDYITKTVNKHILHRHEVELNKFTRIETSLSPNGSPQERVWNIYYYMNKYGLDFVNNLLSLPMQIDGRHKIIKI